MVGEELFLFCRLLFCLVDCVLCFIEASQFQEVPFIYCCSQCLCYRRFKAKEGEGENQRGETVLRKNQSTVEKTKRPGSAGEIATQTLCITDVEQ